MPDLLKGQAFLYHAKGVGTHNFPVPGFEKGLRRVKSFDSIEKVVYF